MHKWRFVKIAVLFTFLIPSLVLPTDDRETTLRTPRELRLNIYKKLPQKCDFSCTPANFSLPLQPQSEQSVCRHSYKKRLFALVLEQRNPENFSNPKQESDKCPLVCLIRCVPQRLTYQRGHSLFILVSRVIPEPRC